MPYAQQHYPFDENSTFQPADFIAEGLDQTRGWFYTLLVIGTGLFGTSPYKNVIVNGIVLAEDGEKMSKSKGNYPPVTDILDEFGADALRLYLINTPVVRAGDIQFSSTNIREVVRRYSMMLKNATKFLFEMVGVYQQTTSATGPYTLSTLEELKFEKLTVTDEWILQCLNELIESVHCQMDKYELNGIVDKFYRFIDQLSRWYMNLNKKRYKACYSRAPIDVLGVCLYYFSLISAPFAPFITESVFQQLRSLKCPSHELESIHFHRIPKSKVWDSDGDLLDLFDYVSDIVDMVREIRGERENSSAKLPLRKIVLCHHNFAVLDKLKKIGDLLKTELNIEHLVYDHRENELVEYDVQLNIPEIKKRVQGRQIGEAIKYINGLTPDQKQSIGERHVVFDDSPVWYSELKIIKNPKAGEAVKTTNRITVQFDDSITPDLLEKYTANQFHRAYQQARKEAKLAQTDRIIFEYNCSPELNAIINKYGVAQRNDAVFISGDIDPDEYDEYLICTRPKLQFGEVTILLRKQ
jgi:isoleucyl-tRNA synthetase